MTISPGFGESLGGVTFALQPQKMIDGRPLPADSVVLDGGDGRLRVDGSDTGRDMRIVSFQPDAQHPTSALAEHWPAAMGRENAAAADVKSIRLTVGGHLAFGHADGEVLAIEGVTSEHPARAILRLSRVASGGDSTSR